MGENKKDSIVLEIVLCVETNLKLNAECKKIKSNEMNKRRSSLPSTDLKQTGITQFVERELKKDQPIKFIGARRSSQTGVQTPETNSSTERVSKKRTRQEVSIPDSSTEKQPSK